MHTVYARGWGIKMIDDQGCVRCISKGVGHKKFLVSVF